jgi:lipopolysaccharide export system ATP-binding protein
MYRRARLGVGYLPQEASIFRGLSVEANIRAVLEVVENEPRQTREEKLDSLFVGVPHIAFAQVGINFTFGRRTAAGWRSPARLRPTRHSCCSTSPLLALIPSRYPIFKTWFRHLTRRGIGVLITDHNVRETLGLIDRAYIMNAGVLLTHGRPNEIVANADVRRLYLGEQFSL